MAELFIKQAEQYAEGRPSYPQELFDFIASKTPSHDLAWDVGAGSGQAARSLAGIYKNVIATDTSPKQLQFAPKLPNIRYQQTPPTMSIAELEGNVAPQSSIDVVTIAQAIHWFDLPNFYQQVRWILKKPHGIIAAWCYTVPEVNDSVDAVFQPYYNIALEPYWESGTSWSAYQTAREKGVELLSNDVIEEFKRAWTEDGQDKKLAGIYKNVIATDTSPKQLSFAPRLPNIRYQQTPPTMSIAELECNVAPQSSIDVVTIAQAIHWFDLPNFYQQVKWILKKPHGVIAAWCYTNPEVNDSIDAVFQPFYNFSVETYWEPAPERLMDFDNYFTYLRSLSSYQAAREKGVELLSNDVIEEFKRAWTEDGQDKKVVKFPIYLRIGRVGNV
uniref:Methyltransferase type 11 domain-containing protein n=1 Tax=Fagus sylvatica TaxID=28930 RepID=A0A2N9IB67_FAGSY